MRFNKIYNSIFLGTIIIIFISCKDEFLQIDPTNFNKQIENKTDISTIDQLIKLYYNYPEIENNSDLKVVTKKQNDSIFSAILIHDNLRDDSIKATKIVMKAKRNEKTWIVIEIKESWKCWKKRGHTKWGIKPCI